MKFRALNYRQALWRKLAALLLFSTLLLGTQVATLTHAIEHPFHPHHELCDSFLVFQHHAALLAFVAVVAFLLTVSQHTGITQYTPIALTSLSSNIRAPPAISALR